MQLRQLLLLVACAIAALCTVNAQYCLNEQGVAVDWWIIMKVPRLTSSSDPGVSVGTAYLYADAASYQTPATFWSQSAHQITDASSAAGLTLQQIYAGGSDNGYVMYNDETPSGTTSMTYGHSKGMLAWSKDSSFWLIHSVPKYADSPQNVQEYAYPSTGEEYGQTMLCLSIDLQNVDLAFEQFQYTNPQVYGSQWVASLASSLPNGDAFLNQGTVNTNPVSNIVNITTMGGMSFTHFAKTVAWGKSIYGDLIGPFYAEDMVVETWQRPYEAPLLPPSCQDAVYSVLTMNAPAYANWDGVGWKYSQDHAKWGIVTDRDVPAICIGDINKQVSQWQRSGGMACILDPIIHNAFATMIATTDEGPSGPVAPPKIATE